MLISEATPKSYIEYLTERNYDYILTGDDHVDYASAFEVLYDKYNCRVIRTDSGGILTNVLLEQGLVDEVSLIISPCLVGKDMPYVFRSLSLNKNIGLDLISHEVVGDDYLSLVYKVADSA